MIRSPVNELVRVKDFGGTASKGARNTLTDGIIRLVACFYNF